MKKIFFALVVGFFFTLHAGGAAYARSYQETDSNKAMKLGSRTNSEEFDRLTSREAARENKIEVSYRTEPEATPPPGEEYSATSGSKKISRKPAGMSFSQMALRFNKDK